MGERLCSKPKILLEVAGKTLLERHLEKISTLPDIDTVCLVTGFQSNLVDRMLPPKVRAIFNQYWKKTDTLGSLSVAFPVLTGETLVIHGDLLWPKKLVTKMFDADGDVVISVDRDSMDAEAMKVRASGSQILGLSKSYDPGLCVGESMGVFLFRKSAIKPMKSASEALMRRRPETAVVDDAVTEICRAGVSDVRTTDVTGLHWIEIDTATDLGEAERLLKQGSDGKQ